jgi:glutamate-5-semialdehyde dehydrogenase
MVASQTAPASLVEAARHTRGVARQLGELPAAERNWALEAMTQGLEAAAPTIVAANQADCEAAEAEGLSPALVARLKLGETKLQAAIAGVRDVARLPDPLGVTQIHRELDRGLVLQRVTRPLGTIGVIFEARPDALVQIASLALKSGNGAILKGGKEATRTCQALIEAIHGALAQTAADPEALRLLTTREQTQALLALEGEIDLIVPRGSSALVRDIQRNTNIPVLGHADGICHLYVDEAADLEQAVQLAVDAKTQYPAACNALETLLVHQAIAGTYLPQVAAALQAEEVQLRGDERTQEFLQVTAASEQDWATEYGDLTLAVRVVDSLEAAIAHVNAYGSHHTDAIATQDSAAAETFLAQIDSANAFHNCSTRFSDGFRYGLGAEVGISTQKMPPRGPVGLEGLVTYQYRLRGGGHRTAPYTGESARPFTHRDLA